MNSAGQHLSRTAIAIGILDSAILAAGFVCLICWLLRTSLGRRALTKSAVRRNNMPLLLPLILLCVWFGFIILSLWVSRMLTAGLQKWQEVVFDNIAVSIGATLTIAVVLCLAWATFARRLKGFGLDVKTLRTDVPAAFVNLLAVWPVILAAIAATTYIARFIWPDYRMPRHEELETITTYTQWSVRISVFVVAAVVAPALEEMLFRGMFQTVIRSFVGKVWLSIGISSVIFAMAHANTAHWPALFVLGACMGYAYEKSGSLLRPIFIHSLFNAVTVLAALYYAQPPV